MANSDVFALIKTAQTFPSRLVIFLILSDSHKAMELNCGFKATTAIFELELFCRPFYSQHISLEEYCLIELLDHVSSWYLRRMVGLTVHWFERNATSICFFATRGAGKVGQALTAVMMPTGWISLEIWTFWRIISCSCSIYLTWTWTWLEEDSKY